MTQSISDPYAVLGIPRDASHQTALEAYRRLAKQYHPDVAADPAAGERMRRINEAWRVLSSPPRSARHDAAATPRPSTAGRSGPSGRAPRTPGYQWARARPSEVPHDTVSPWSLVAGAIGATVLLFGVMTGLLPPLFVVLLVLGASRLFRTIG
jgi:hypothetical protein